MEYCVMMQFPKIAFLEQTSYYQIQKQDLFSVINEIDKSNRTKIFLLLNSNKLEPAEDGRCDTHNYNVKNGT